MSWYCDVCGQKIQNSNDGYVIWKTQPNAHGFKIIHQGKCDLQGNYIASAALDDFLGANGLAYLLTKLSYGVIAKNLGATPHCDITDFDEYVDFIRRVQTPSYEEARRRFSNPNLISDYSDANELLPYTQSELERIIKTY